MDKRILIIEDDHSIRINLIELLEENGYTVGSAATAGEGLRLAREMKPDLIISDIMLPDNDGYFVLEQISKIRSISVVPFVFLTARAGMQDIRKGMLSGAADYLTKPYDAGELIRVVELRLAKAEEIKKQFKKDNAGAEGVKKQLGEDDKIIVMANGRPVFIKLSQIIYIEAENVYTLLYTSEAKPVLVRKTMKQWEQILPENMFIRIHRSTIVNTNHIERVEKWFNRSYKINIKNSEKMFIVSQRYSAKLKSRII